MPQILRGDLGRGLDPDSIRPYRLFHRERNRYGIGPALDVKPVNQGFAISAAIKHT